MKSARELNGELGQSLWWFVIGAAILTLASLGVAWVIGGRISRPTRGPVKPELP